MKRPPIGNAARALHIIYEGQPWYCSAGNTDDSIIVYTTKKRVPSEHVLELFVGYPVEFRKMGKPKPA